MARDLLRRSSRATDPPELGSSVERGDEIERVAGGRPSQIREPAGALEKLARLRARIRRYHVERGAIPVDVEECLADDERHPSSVGRDRRLTHLSMRDDLVVG